MIFNIYYINFPKVYEIKMMLGNIILLNKELESNKNIEGGVDIGAKIDIGTKFFKMFNVEGEGKGRIAGSSAQKVLETFDRAQLFQSVDDLTIPLAPLFEIGEEGPE